ncbi:MAG: hypothetical protein J7M19_02805 [Planctomycetes bacterium]|nr:hypothetical protein [Planctomycetota bacterium]
MFKRKLALEEESSLFILVNFADLVLTGLAFSVGAREVNILANWVIVRFGLTGMVIYKFALVTFVLLICQYVHITHPKTARIVLVAGSVAYSVLIVGVTVSLFVYEFQAL